MPVSLESSPCILLTHLAHTCALISAEAPAYAVCGWCNGGQAVSIGLLGIGSHAGNGQNLLVFLDSLLQLAEEHAQAWEGQSEWGAVLCAAAALTSGIVARPEGRGETGRHGVVCV